MEEKNKVIKYKSNYAEMDKSLRIDWLVMLCLVSIIIMEKNINRHNCDHKEEK